MLSRLVYRNSDALGMFGCLVGVVLQLSLLLQLVAHFDPVADLLPSFLPQYYQYRLG